MFNRKNINLLIIGADGMLGSDVLKRFNLLARSKSSRINRVTGVTIDDLDIKDFGALYSFFEGSTKYDWCINCAAFTNTSAAEGEMQNESYAVNALACRNLARICRTFKTKLLHISTDYVFSENSTNCNPFPVNKYGMHKLVGELFIRTEMDEDAYCIVRTSWLYGDRNSKSFVHRFTANLKKIDAENRTKASDWGAAACVNDQFSVPTSTEFLSEFVSTCVETGATGVLSGVPTAADPVSKYMFAAKIFKYYDEHGRLDGRTTVKAVETGNASMTWPLNSTLLPHGFTESEIYQKMTGPTEWRECLEAFLDKYGEKIWKSA